MTFLPGDEEVEEDAQVDEAPNEMPEGTSDDGGADQDDLAAEWEAMVGDENDDQQAGQSSTDPDASRVLNQDEIDSLLGLSDVSDESADQSGLNTILNSGLVSAERLPMLEVVFDRLVRMMSTSLRNFTSDNVEVSLDSIDSLRFGDYLNALPLPTMLGVFKAEEWDNFGLMSIDSSLIYSTVDVLLGGRRGTAAMRVEGRPFTTIERNLVERMLHVILADLSSAFGPLSPVTFRFERLETNPRFATISRPGNAVVVAKLRIDMEDRGGRLELLIPYATLEPVRELLLQMFMGEKSGVGGSIWETHLAEELWKTDIELTAVLDQLTMTLGDVFDFKVGSQLQLNAQPDSVIEVLCGDVLMFSGKMGRKGDTVAVRINERHTKDRTNENWA